MAHESGFVDLGVQFELDNCTSIARPQSVPDSKTGIVLTDSREAAL